MLVQEPSHGHVGGADLSEEHHHSEHHHEVHEVECLVEGHGTDDVMAVCLVVDWRGTSDNKVQNIEIMNEIPCCVEQGPDVDVSWSVQAFVVVEHGLVVATDVEHGDGGHDGSAEGMDGGYDAAAIKSPSFVILISVCLVVLHAS